MNGDDWQAAQHADECARQQRLDEILRASVQRPLTEQEQVEIATEVGLGVIYRKHRTQPRRD